LPAGLGRYILRRVAFAAIVMFGMITLVFFISRVIPSDTAQLYVGPKATAEQLRRAAEELGLNRPLHEQYLTYVSKLLTGDWGISLRAKTPVLGDVLKFLPATLELVICAYVVAILIGIPLGVFSAVRQNSMIDHGGRILAVAGVSIPSFWLALLLQLLFFGTLGVLPLVGRLDIESSILHPISNITGFHVLDSLLTMNVVAFVDSARHLVLPSIALCTYPLGLITRMTRSMMIEVLNEPYIRFARANGMIERLVIFKYALKNAIIPTLTVLGLSFSYSITGAFLVETIFTWPGLGTYTVNSILEVDYPAIIGVVIFGTVFYVVINLLVDIVQAYLDPRVRLR